MTAYLNSNINFDMYIEQFKDFVERGENMMWKLWKTLYGTMQDSHDWFKILSHVYKELGYKQSWAEQMIHIWCNRENFTITCIYPDDTMGSSSDEKETE